MHDHIHRQIAHSRAADRQREQSWARHSRNIRDRPPPWIRRQAASAIARAAARVDAESARRAIAS